MDDLQTRIIQQLQEPITAISAFYDNDIEKIFNALMVTDFESKSYGFWIWDLRNEKEFYSPNFRKSLGYENEIDFQNIPQSWMDAIEKESLDLALKNFDAHVATGGKHAYAQRVTYNKKHGGKVNLICHGRIVKWEKDKPRLMVGVHFPEEFI